MINKHHKILAGILIAQIVLSIVIFWPRPSTAGQRDPVFADLEAEDVTALTIEDAEGNVIELERVAGEWVLPEAGQYPAKGDAVSALLDKLTALTTGRLVTSSDTSHRRLQVASDDFVRRVAIETSDGTRETLYLGSSPQYGSMHFRLEGQRETFLTSKLSTWDVAATANTWIDTQYHSLAQEDLDRVTLENAQGTFVFERQDEENWTMGDLTEEESLDQAQIRSVIRRAATLSMEAPLGKEEQPSFGMDEPNAVVTLETADRTVTLLVGARDADDASYVVKSSESDYYVHVAEASLKTLLESDRESFLTEPPTPQAESSDS
jgi:hypothetical protein